MGETGKRTELIVGVFILVGLAALAALIFQFGRFGERFAKTYPLTVVYEDASGLVKGSEVRMGGAHIGKVADLPRLNDKLHVEVPLVISENIRIPRGSHFEISSVSLLGDKLIDVVLPKDRSQGAIAPGSTILGAGPGGLDALQSTAGNLGKSAGELMQSAGATLARIDTAADAIASASKRLDASLATLHSTYLTDENARDIRASLAAFRDSSARIQTASEQLGPALVEARDTIERIHRAADQADQTLADVRAAVSDARPAIQSITPATTSLQRTAEEARKTLAHINQGEGFLGALARDNDISLDAKAFFRNLRRYGVLRYRDAATPAAQETQAPEHKSPHFSPVRRFGRP